MSRYLIVCDGGNVRSHALAYILKWDYHQEAIAIGRIYMSEETMRTFSEWADTIVTVQPHMIESIPEDQQAKVVCYDMGTDRWGYSFKPDLIRKAQEGAKILMGNTE